MIKIQQGLLFLLSVILFNNINVYAATLENNVIEVRGQATVSMEPDNFAVALDIMQTGRNISKIRVFVDSKSEQVIAMAKSLSIAEININATQIHVQVAQEQSNIYIQGVEVKQRQVQNNNSKVYVGGDFADSNTNNIQNFELSRTITIIFSTLDDYDAFLSNVIKMGIERTSPLVVSVSKSEGSYQQALSNAIKNAKNKAKKIAQQAHLTLGKMTYLKELSSNDYQAKIPVANTHFDFTLKHQPQVIATAISASVLVKFAIRE